MLPACLMACQEQTALLPHSLPGRLACLACPGLSWPAASGVYFSMTFCRIHGSRQRQTAASDIGVKGVGMSEFEWA